MKESNFVFVMTWRFQILEQSCPIEFSALMETLCIMLSNMVAIGHGWLLSTLNMASATEGHKFKLYLILINLHLCSHMWLVATILDGETLKLCYNLPHGKDCDMGFLCTSVTKFPLHCMKSCGFLGTF